MDSTELTKENLAALTKPDSLSNVNEVIENEDQFGGVGSEVGGETDSLLDVMANPEKKKPSALDSDQPSRGKLWPISEVDLPDIRLDEAERSFHAKRGRPRERDGDMDEDMDDEEYQTVDGKAVEPGSEEEKQLNYKRWKENIQRLGRERARLKRMLGLKPSQDLSYSLNEKQILIKIEEMRYDKLSKASLQAMRSLIIVFCLAYRWLLLINPIHSIDIKGWCQSIFLTLNDYDEYCYDIYDQYGPLFVTNPISRLAMALLGNANKYIVLQLMLTNQSAPNFANMQTPSGPTPAQFSPANTEGVGTNFREQYMRDLQKTKADQKTESKINTDTSLIYASEEMKKKDKQNNNKDEPEREVVEGDDFENEPKKSVELHTTKKRKRASSAKPRRRKKQHVTESSDNNNQGKTVTLVKTN